MPSWVSSGTALPGRSPQDEQILSAGPIDIGNSLFVDIARGAESAAGQAQLKLLLANSDSTRTKQDNYLELFDQARVAGVLLTPLEEPLDVAHAVLGHGRPVVLVIATSPDPLTCSVMVNEELGGYLAATHLLDRGARKLAFLAGCPALRLIRRRLAGVERAVAEVGASLGVVEAPDLSISAGREVGRLVLLSQSVDGAVVLQICSPSALSRRRPTRNPGTRGFDGRRLRRQSLRI